MTFVLQGRSDQDWKDIKSFADYPTAAAHFRSMADYDGLRLIMRKVQIDEQVVLPLVVVQLPA